MCTRLYKIENRILEITRLMDRSASGRGLSGREMTADFIEAEMRNQDKSLLKEKRQLELERQFILDRRDSLLWRIIWNIIVPISVTLITTFVILKVGLFLK